MKPQLSIRSIHFIWKPHLSIWSIHFVYHQLNSRYSCSVCQQEIVSRSLWLYQVRGSEQLLLILLYNKYYAPEFVRSLFPINGNLNFDIYIPCWPCLSANKKINILINSVKSTIVINVTIVVSNVIRSLYNNHRRHERTGAGIRIWLYNCKTWRMKTKSLIQYLYIYFFREYLKEYMSQVRNWLHDYKWHISMYLMHFHFFFFDMSLSWFPDCFTGYQVPPEKGFTLKKGICSQVKQSLAFTTYLKVWAKIILTLKCIAFL